MSDAIIPTTAALMGLVALSAFSLGRHWHTITSAVRRRRRRRAYLKRLRAELRKS